jgi:hypothetical protein
MTNSTILSLALNACTNKRKPQSGSLAALQAAAAQAGLRLRVKRLVEAPGFVVGMYLELVE